MIVLTKLFVNALVMFGTILVILFFVGGFIYITIDIYCNIFEYGGSLDQLKKVIKERKEKRKEKRNDFIA